MTWNILYKGGEGEGFFKKWLLPENGFSPKMASPRKWLLPGNGFSWEITSPQEIQSTSHFNLISFWHYFGKNLTPVAKVGLINILYQNIRYCQEKVIDPGQFVCLCLLNDLNLHGVPNIVCSIMIINNGDMCICSSST